MRQDCKLEKGWAGNILICIYIIIQSEGIKGEKAREERTSGPRETEMSCCCAYLLFSFVVERWKSGPLLKSSAPEPSHTLVPAVHLTALGP